MQTNQATHTPGFDYFAAKTADDLFQAELERQFGKKAGDMRYVPAAHDAKTKHARAVYLKSMLVNA